MYFFILFLFISGTEESFNPLIVDTSLGPILGRKVSNSANQSFYYAFQGIPYAKPPVQELRFQPPVPIEPWTEILNTTYDPPFCVQDKGGKEDCLYLSVYTPQLGIYGTYLRAVMVYFHGGSFSTGSAEFLEQKPDNFMTSNVNVILVVPQYRLNVFGFLSTNDKFAEGNAGLKDQIVALEWVQKNIISFGGDPNKVTIFGQSAGGASVVYLMSSSLTKGLFHAAISESGSVLNRWAFQRDPLTNVINLARTLNINDTDTETLVTKLQNIPAEQLFNAISLISETLNPFPFVPVKERSHPNAVIVEDVYYKLEAGRYMTNIPLLCGYNENEAAVFWQLSYLTWILPTNISLLVPPSLNIDMNSTEQEHLLKDIINYYFADKQFRAVNIYQFADDELFVRGIRKQIELMRNHSKVYAYKFTYNDMGHSAELAFLFNTNFSSNPDVLTSKRMIKLWTNFAKYKNPTPYRDPLLNNLKWENVPKNNSITPFLKISNKLAIYDNIGQANFKFWEEIFYKYGNPPFETW